MSEGNIIAYYDSVVHRYNHYTTRIPPLIVRVSQMTICCQHVSIYGTITMCQAYTMPLLNISCCMGSKNNDVYNLLIYIINHILPFLYLSGCLLFYTSLDIMHFILLFSSIVARKNLRISLLIVLEVNRNVIFGHFGPHTYIYIYIYA